VNGRSMHLGYFDTAEEAARAFARAYLRQHGGPPAHAPSVAGQFRQEEEGEGEIDQRSSREAPP